MLSLKLKAFTTVSIHSTLTAVANQNGQPNCGIRAPAIAMPSATNNWPENFQAGLSSHLSSAQPTRSIPTIPPNAPSKRRLSGEPIEVIVCCNSPEANPQRTKTQPVNQTNKMPVSTAQPPASGIGS
jgi:hypothetical protein